MSEVNWLRAVARGDRLELAAAGQWTADNAAEIEKIIIGVMPKRGEVSRVDIDMGPIEQFDTYGAWLLERLVTGMAESGSELHVHRLAERHRTLFENVHGVKRPPPRRNASNAGSSALPAMPLAKCSATATSRAIA